MKAVLYLLLTPEPTLSFNHARVAAVKNLLNTSYTFFDVDNHSEAELINYANRLITEAERVFVIVDIEHKKNSMNQLQKVFNQLLRQRKKVTVIQLGASDTTQQIATVLGRSFIEVSTEEALLSALLAHI